jgi:hypothetical protein
MAFETMNFCRSTEVAVNIFHMFKNNTVNLVSADLSGDSWVQYEDVNYPLEEGEVKPYDNRSLKFISELLHGECSKFRIHDIETRGRRESRRLQFFVRTRNYGKVIFSVTVYSQYLDGDEVSGWTRWQMEGVTVQAFGKKKYQFRLSPLNSFPNVENYLSAQMKENIGHTVCFENF